MRQKSQKRKNFTQSDIFKIYPKNLADNLDEVDQGDCAVTVDQSSRKANYGSFGYSGSRIRQAARDQVHRHQNHW